jgi:hypothetical protein
MIHPVRVIVCTTLLCYSFIKFGKKIPNLSDQVSKWSSRYVSAFAIIPALLPKEKGAEKTSPGV